MAGRELSSIVVWTQTPLARRTVTLPAGSYSIRASSVQRGSVTITSGNGNQTAAISSVTVARTQFTCGGCRADTTSVNSALATGELQDETTVKADRGSTTGNATITYDVTEFY